MTHRPTQPTDEPAPEGVRITFQGLKLLKAFWDGFSESVRSELSGADVIRAARLSAGTVYPLLLRFERSGILQSRWEELSPSELKRPRRRLYKLTAAGALYAQKILISFSTAGLSSAEGLR